MNDQIRELAIQSNLPTALDYHQKRYEKFAELLIKDILEIQRQLKIAGVSHGSDMDQALLVYFGIE